MLKNFSVLPLLTDYVNSLKQQLIIMILQQVILWQFIFLIYLFLDVDLLEVPTKRLTEDLNLDPTNQQRSVQTPKASQEKKPQKSTQSKLASHKKKPDNQNPDKQTRRQTWTDKHTY